MNTSDFLVHKSNFPTFSLCKIGPYWSKSYTERGNLLRGIVNWSGTGRSVSLTAVSVTIFHYLNLKQKNIFFKTMLAIYGFHSENIFYKKNFNRLSYVTWHSWTWDESAKPIKTSNLEPAILLCYKLSGSEKRTYVNKLRIPIF